MANGFQTSAPARHGASGIEAGRLYGQRFTAPGSVPIEITRIGVWAFGTASAVGRLAIYTDDATNARPELMVSGSETASINMPAAWTDIFETYSSPVELNGGTVYWLVAFSDEINMIYSYLNNTGVGVSGSPTFPTWPVTDEWHGFPARTYDSALYAVYQEAAGGVAGAASYYNSAS